MGSTERTLVSSHSSRLARLERLFAVDAALRHLPRPFVQRFAARLRACYGR